MLPLRRCMLSVIYDLYNYLKLTNMDINNILNILFYTVVPVCDCLLIIVLLTLYGPNSFFIVFRDIAKLR